VRDHGPHEVYSRRWLRQDLPAVILYKYFPQERLDVLQSGLIAYPPPWMFNDPFEARPVYPADDAYAIELGGQLTGDAPTDREIRRRIGELRSTHGIHRITIEQAASSVGVLSLSETRDNPLMWAHYTSQHTGFVIGFDVAHPSWQELHRTSGPDAPEPTKVTYAETRITPARILDVTPELVWYTKSGEWAYEQEWRCTRLTRKAVKSVRVHDAEIPLFPFAKQAVTQVILGHRAPSGLDLEVHQLLFDPDYKNLKILRAEPDQKSFRLNIVPA
jgi:hypothetical protein